MNSNDSSNPSSKSLIDHSPVSKPGVLQGEVWLIVQTERAQRFIYGRRKSADKPAIWGLFKFAENVKILWLAASQDDPYADWWLVKADEAIRRCRDIFGAHQDALNVMLGEQCALEIGKVQSIKPQRISLKFSNPYAFRAAQLLAEYDRLMCLFMSALHVGAMDQRSLDEQLSACSRKLRAVFTAPQGFQALGVHRGLLKGGGDRIEKAKSVMGEVPEEIINGMVSPSLRPRTNPVSKHQAGHSIPADKPHSPATKIVRSIEENEGEPQGFSPTISQE